MNKTAHRNTKLIIIFFSTIFLFGSLSSCMMSSGDFQNNPPQVTEPLKTTVRTPDSINVDDPATEMESWDAEMLSTKEVTVEKRELDWKEMPVIPGISEKTVEIYLKGLEKGNNPNSFSKVGDCESRTTWFLYDFDQKKETYSLEPYDDLSEVIEYYQGSFGRLSLVAKPGFSAASVLTPIWTDREQCDSNETPLGCEYRLHKPSLSLIMLGTNDVSRPDTFEANMRKVIEFTIEQGVVPVLATKADNLEGDGQINSKLAALAKEYDIPLWNFWLAVQPLPNKGLQPDGAHLTWGPNRFDDQKVMQQAWPVRNLTALQVLDTFMESTKHIK